MAGIAGLRYVSQEAMAMEHWPDFAEGNRPAESDYGVLELRMGKVGIDRVVADAEVALASLVAADL